MTRPWQQKQQQSVSLSFTGHVRCTHSVKWLTLTDKKEVRAGAPGQEMERERVITGETMACGDGAVLQHANIGEKRRGWKDSNNPFVPVKTNHVSPCTRSARLSIRGKAERTFI